MVSGESFMKKIPPPLRMVPLLAMLCCIVLRPLGGGAAPAVEMPPLFTGQAAVSQLNSGDYTVRSGFSSHLPIVVLEPASADVTVGAAAARLLLYDAPGGENTLQDAPAASIAVTMADTAYPPMTAMKGKTSFILELADAEPVSLAGLPPDKSWLLQGTLRDKSMLRNGIAYELGRILLPESSPQTRFCEVLLRQGGALRYQGIHILAENPDRIHQELAAQSGDAVLLKYTTGQERRGDHIVRAGSRIFTVVPMTPGQTLSQDDRRRIGIELEKLESLLYSVHPGTFLKYQASLDERSAVNFFILNNIMLNALDTAAPFSLLKSRDGKYQFIPEWEFDTAVDNAPERKEPLPFEEKVEEISPPSILSRKVPVWRILENGGDISDLRMYPVYEALNGENFLWFDRLFLSRSFINELYARYHQLRRSHFSPGKLTAMVDGMAAGLGPAMERDWFRWRAEYVPSTSRFALLPYVDGKNVEHNRQTTSYDQELVKITHCLREQDLFILAQLEELDWMTADLYDKSTSGARQAGWALLTLIGMFILTHLLTRNL